MGTPQSLRRLVSSVATRAARADVSPREPIRSRISACRREKRSITRRGAGNRIRKGAPASGDLAPPRLITTADVPERRRVRSPGGYRGNDARILGR
jgi:hypothetical protein